MESDACALALIYTAFRLISGLLFPNRWGMQTSGMTAYAAYLVLLDNAVLVVYGRGVPGDANGSAVLVPHGQDSHLLGGGAGSWAGEQQLTYHPVKLAERASLVCRRAH